MDLIDAQGALQQARITITVTETVMLSTTALRLLLLAGSGILRANTEEKLMSFEVRDIERN